MSIQFRERALAASLKHGKAICKPGKFLLIPRARARGLIEALSIRPPSRPTPQFRERALAASLKPLKNGRQILGVVQFRERALAASLKLDHINIAAVNHIILGNSASARSRPH